MRFHDLRKPVICRIICKASNNFRMNMMGLGETVIIFDPEDIKEMYRYGKRKDKVIFGIECLVVLS